MAMLAELADLEVYHQQSVAELDGHQSRVRRMATVLYLAMTGELPLSYEGQLNKTDRNRGGRTTREASLIEVAAGLHDLGKLCLPNTLIDKNGPLTPEERSLIQSHPLWGYIACLLSYKHYRTLIKPIDRGYLAGVDFTIPISWMVLYHHENYDGTGYPERIAGENIPLGARIIRVVDTFDAMRSARPYKKPCSQEEALTEIERQSGKMFDPTIAECFVRLKRGGNLSVDEEYG